MQRLIIICLFILSTVSYGQIGGEATYQFLTVPVSARLGALGGSVIAVKDDDPNLAIDNPSLLSAEMSETVSLTYLNFFADINYGYFSYVKDLKKYGTFSSGIKYIDYGTFLETDEGGNEFGNFTAAEYALILGWGKNIDSLFSVGANLKPIYSKLYSYSSFGLAFDLSGTYYNPKKEVTVSALIKNIGSQITTYVNGSERESIPFEVQVGFSKRLKYVPFRISVDFTHLQNWSLSFNDSTAATILNNQLTEEEKNERNKTGILSEAFRHIVFGGEFLPSKSFMLRFGFNLRRRAELAVDSRPGLVGFSWGFGFRIKKIHVSYGSARYHLSGSSNHFTITTKFSDYYGKKKKVKPYKEKKVKSDNKKKEEI